MTFREGRKFFVDELTGIYEPEEIKNISWLVAEYIGNRTRTELIKTQEDELTVQQLHKLREIITRLNLNEPVQYVLGKAWFGGLIINVNKHVLIPRPETEELVEWVVKEIQNPVAIGSKFKIQNILDIGTGSGCIAILMKKKIPEARISAIDVCREAIHTAMESAAEHNTEIDFLLMDFLDEKKWREMGNFDIIVSNPPYVRVSEVGTMHERVKNFEPRQALFAPGNDALLFYNKLTRFAKQHLKSEGGLFVEINEHLGQDVVQLFQSAGLKNVELRKDMQGKDRMVRATVV